MKTRLSAEAQEAKKRKREKVAIGLISISFVVLTVIEFRLARMSSTLPLVNSIFFFGLLNLNLILLIALIWLVFRNIGKLFLERRSRVLGARLKTKLVAAFLAFSIIPTLLLFTISSSYINSSFDKWFSIKIQNTLQSSLEITGTYYRNTETTAMHFAEHISDQLEKRLQSTRIDFRQPAGGAPTWVAEFLESQRDLLALHSVEFYHDPLDERTIVKRKNSAKGSEETPVEYPRLPLDTLDRAFQNESIAVVQHIGSGDLIRCLSPVKFGNQTGVIVVNSFVPITLVNKVDEIASVIGDYRDTNPLKYPIKTTYFVILVMITLVILFVAIWVGLYLARQLTVPIERLVHGAQAVGSGDLDVKVDSVGHDEISVLMESFNRMTRALKEATADREKRRSQLEAVLANVGTGVIVVESSGIITTFNRAASQLLNLTENAVIGHPYDRILANENLPLSDTISRTLHRPSSGEPSSTPVEVAQWTCRTDDSTRSLAAIASPLLDQGLIWGAVVVIDDMTHIMKGQREMAWREVARRIAHEIKNPLTPIKLSAQRLQRRFSHLHGKEGAILKECTETIVKHTDELKEMVNEFSSFARLPEAEPAPNDLNTVTHEVVTLYSQAHPEIDFRFLPEKNVPAFEFDRDQIKRVLVNLVDNAVGIFSEMPVKQEKMLIQIETHYNDQLEMAVVSVEDNGPGMSEEVRSRLFEPYFSTKKEGTGLGLAIAKRIVNDHDGFIRVQSSPGKGTRFLIELPTTVKRNVEIHPHH